MCVCVCVCVIIIIIMITVINSLITTETKIFIYEIISIHFHHIKTIENKQYITIFK